MSDPRRRRRRVNRETVGTLKLTYKPGATGPDLPAGLAREVEVQHLRSEMPKFRIPGPRGGTGRQPASTVTISFYRTRGGGAPGLTVIGSVELRPADLTDVELINPHEVDVPDLS